MRKKILSLGLILAMSLSLAACGGKDDASQTPAANEATEAPAATDAPADDVTEEDDAASDDDASTITSLTELEGILTCGYAGVATDDENTGMYLAMNDDATFSLLIIASATEKENLSFVGESTINDDGTMTINDESSQTSITFGVQDNEDGTFTLDYGDIGTAMVAECEVSEVLEMMDIIDQNTTSAN